MVTGLEEIYAVVTHKIDEEVFQGQSSRPNAGCYMFERLRFPDTAKRIPQDNFD
jgi:hypothetical protein